MTWNMPTCRTLGPHIGETGRLCPVTSVGHPRSVGQPRRVNQYPNNVRQCSGNGRATPRALINCLTLWGPVFGLFFLRPSRCCRPSEMVHRKCLTMRRACRGPLEENCLGMSCPLGQVYTVSLEIRNRTTSRIRVAHLSKPQSINPQKLSDHVRRFS